MIHVDPESLHGRWFKFCAACWASFTDGRGPDTYRTNLCTFFWTSVGAPLFVFGAHLMTLAIVVWCTLGYGITRLTFLGFLIEVGIVAAFFVFIYGMSKGIEYLCHRKEDKKWEPPKEKHDGFFTLLFKYVVAAKQRVCPLMKLED
jgi:hypothetical protein